MAENGPKLPPIELNVEETKGPSKKNLEGSMCFVTEWYRERLPHEYCNGSILTRDRGHTPRKENILIFADSCGVCPNEKTGAEGFMGSAPQDRVGSVTVISTPPLEMAVKDFVAAIGTTPWDIIVFGYSCENVSKDCTDVQELIKLQEAVQELWLAMMQHIQIAKNCNRVVILTLGAHTAEPLEHQFYGIGTVTHANMIGCTNTARLEFAEGPRVHYVDCPQDTPSMQLDVASEVFREEGFGTNNVLLNPPGPDEPNEENETVEGRYVQRQMTSRLYQERKFRWLLPKKGTILITGGNGSLGLIMGKWLQAKATESPYSHPLTILFLSRSTKISPGENQRSWSEIQANATRLGMTVEQVACDFSNPSAVSEFIAKHSPNICGIIHSAGVLRDSTLRNQTWEKFKDVFESKSHAALYIHDALMKHSNPDLYFFWMFSSIAVLGSPGQSNYSASNAMLDGLARYRRGIGLPGTTIQWGAWGEAGMAASLDAVNRRRVDEGPMPYFTNKEGLKGLEAGLLTDLPTFSVFKYNTTAILAQQDQLAEVAATQFFQNFVQKIAAPKYLDQCGRMAFLRSMTAPSKMLLCPRFTFREYPQKTGGDYQGEDEYHYV
ncbi:hypothetical protein AB1Y20_021256 [Prymnesium parvum]|uniref:Ketoreductase domain-containing protein n=1 Tax=Prymnesium parvum TaxID=97485 RepID=A0AB34JL11_PRYPA